MGLVAAVALAACSTPPAPSRAAEPVAAIDSVVRLWLDADPTPGLSLAVVYRGDTLQMRGYGLADVERGVPVTDSTVFHIGSVTKAFTAAAVMKLVDEERLRLDATVREALPGYRGTGGSVTVRQLLNHTSGIPNYLTLDPGLIYGSATDDELLATFVGEPLQFEPGSHWRYTNSGYLLLGRIVERATGTPFGEHVWQTQLRPLGLGQTGRCGRAAPRQAPAVGTVPRRGRPAAAPPLNPRITGADGAFCSTPRELVRWARALVAGEVVSESAYARMATPTRAPGFERALRADLDYGYGLQLSRVGGRPVVFHGGGFEGFRAALAHYPEDDLTIALLANGPLPALTLQAEIARLLLGLERPL